MTLTKDPVQLLFFTNILLLAAWEVRPDAIVQNAFVGCLAAFLAMLTKKTDSPTAPQPPLPQNLPQPQPIHPAGQL